MTLDPTTSLPRVEGQATVRLRLLVHGIVQGVGFRPFVLLLARRLDLAGWIANSPQGAAIEVEGPPDRIARFRRELVESAPAHARILGMESAELSATGEAGFHIRDSHALGPTRALVLPDLAVCPECLREMRDPEDRRYRYPFVNCTHCGPRYSIITALPYDRAHTTMAAFPLCEDCRREYENPLDRRFHAQPVACPRCGPYLALWDQSGRLLCERDAALVSAAEHLRNGHTVAVKGLGGFHLMVAAGDLAAVHRLRARKHREAKPLAVMFPDLAALARVCTISPAEEEELLSTAAPIVLLDRLSASGFGDVCESVAPGLNTIGAMLPYTPLHHLLLDALRLPVVATSGNLTEEPICTSESDAAVRLKGLADFFLVHNRPIARHVDDPVVRVMSGRPVVLRRGRGLAPASLGQVSEGLPVILAVGADLKNCPAQSYGTHLLTAQHVGDLENARAYEAFQNVTRDLNLLLEQRPARIACDLHPDYHSTRWAALQNLKTHRIQHHHAHVVSCMVDNGLSGEVLGVSWDGTGLGSDGTIWGGEFLVASRTRFSRFAHLRTFSLPGGDRAARDGRLCALGLLYELHGDRAWEAMPREIVDTFMPEEQRNLLVVMRRGLGTHRTSSAGRLFDGVSALLGVRLCSRFEGEAASLLEALAARAARAAGLELPVIAASSGALALDWGPMIVELLQRQAEGVPRAELAQLVHSSLAAAIAKLAVRSGQRRILLTGGCFQNRLLFELAHRALEEAGLQVYRHQRVPPNDGGIAVGQLGAACALEEEMR